MRIVLMGPPGAGKGTQATRLVEEFGMAHLSSGDIFRSEKASGSELGEKLAGYIQAGKLVPDEIVVNLMVKAITAIPAGSGLLLDGFPRTVAQAETLDNQLAQASAALDAVVVITADDGAIVERIIGRRMCPSTGKIYHITFMPPKVEGICDETGEQLIQRSDDTEEVARERLAAYYRQTEPVIAYYRGRDNIDIIEVDGNNTPEEVSGSLIESIANLKVG